MKDYRMDPYNGYIPLREDGVTTFEKRLGVRVTHISGLQASVCDQKTPEKNLEVALAMIGWGQIFQNRLIPVNQQDEENQEEDILD